MKRIILILIAFFVVAASDVSAQKKKLSGVTGTSYNTAVGAKIYFGDGTLGGINIKHFISQAGALEGSLVFATGALGLEGLYEWHGDVNNAPGLKYYIGGGALIGFSTEKNTDNNTSFALRTTIGLDYKISGAPIDVAFDLDPSFLIAPDTGFDFGAGLAFRFAF